MNVGGYTILDFGNYNFTSATKVAKGTNKKLDKLYNAIESSNKAMMVANLTIGGVEYDAYFTPFLVADSAFTSVETVGSKTVTILVAADGITVTLK